MRFLMMIKATEDSEAGAPPSPGLMAAMGALTVEMTESGALLSAEGLKPSAHGARLGYADGGERTVTDGPFAEAKELVGGFAIMQAASLAEAIGLADRVLELHREAGIPEFEVEIRPLYEPTDFGPPPS
jgi:hypothetical protein